jgi:excisionase family DNA binding protein
MSEVNLKTAAQRLGVHYQTAYRWVRSGQLVAVKVGAGYEVSDAAIARLQAQRAATERLADATAATFAEPPTTIDDELEILDHMVEAVTLDATKIGERGARILAAHLGDAAFVYRHEADDRMVVHYAAHRDPIAEVAASTLGRDPRTATSLVRRSVVTGDVICVAQVPQRELRQTMHPELHEHLQLTGCYSAMCVPFGTDGVVLMTRDLPGRPYTNDDVVLAKRIASRMTWADDRVRVWRAAWSLRRAMVEMFSAPTSEGNCFDKIFASSSEFGAEFADPPTVAVLDMELRHVAPSKEYAVLMGDDPVRLTGIPLRSLVADETAFDVALAPVLRGEIDFRSVELDVTANRSRVALHVAVVRHDDATPRGVVLVAHSVPSFAGC